MSNKYLDIAMEKVIKQEVNKVLAKIRADLMKLQTYKMFGGEDTVYVEHEDVLEIIDRYKAESEVDT